MASIIVLLNMLIAMMSHSFERINVLLKIFTIYINYFILKRIMPTWSGNSTGAR
jgi:hypothetical protein